jgi:hypothetical protein
LLGIVAFLLLLHHSCLVRVTLKYSGLCAGSGIMPLVGGCV